MKVNNLMFFFSSVFAGLLLLLLSLPFNGCKDEFTTDPEYKLTMPDSLLFDTVISQTISPTAAFKIYNKTEEAIKIASITLNSSLNYFKININGKSGTSFSNVELRSGDSLFVFVQIVADVHEENAPLLIEDEIRFLYNGNYQRIILSAYSQDANHLREKIHITKDTTWTDERPFLIYDSIIVDSAVTLTIKEGTTLYMKRNATMLVDGTLVIDGSVEKEVIFRTDRKDYIWKDKLYDQESNQWGGIRISSISTGNRIDHAFIRGGAFGIEMDSAMSSEEDYTLIISNSQIHNTYKACLTTHNRNVYAYNSIFSNSNNGCVVLLGGYHQFDHCTISFIGRKSGGYPYALTLSNLDGNTNSASEIPFKATFNNCIVAGDTTRPAEMWDEILFQVQSSIDSLDFRFDHSLIFTDITPDQMEKDQKRFNVVIANENPRFQLVDNTHYLYDLHLSEDSPCKEKGDLGLVLRNEAYKTDKDGVERNVEAAPEMGAYQIVVKTEETETESTD